MSNELMKELIDDLREAALEGILAENGIEVSRIDPGSVSASAITTLSEIVATLLEVMGESVGDSTATLASAIRHLMTRLGLDSVLITPEQLVEGDSNALQMERGKRGVKFTLVKGH